jgi:hypothetical protein
MKIKTINLIIGIISIIGFNILLTNNAEAAFIAATGGSGSMNVLCSECGSDSGNLKLANYKGIVYINVYSRPFNFVKSVGGNLQSNGSVPIGSTLTFSPFGLASGTWTITGGGSDTPDMNSVRYEVRPGGKQDPNAGVAGIAIWRPATTDPIAIIGGGSVSCNGWTCTANGLGTGWITVRFAGGSVEARSMPKYPNESSQCAGNGNKYDCGEDTEYIAYNEQSTTIYFNVFQPNQAHTVNYNGTTNIGYNTATANWTYSDPEGDTQTNSHIQIATDPNFSNIIFNRTQVDSNTSFLINNLNPGTTYYPRVRAKNGPNGWSAWSNGAVFTTQINNPPDLNQLSCSGIGTSYTTGRINWNYTGIDEAGDILILKLRYKKTTDSIWTVVNLPSNKSGIRNINNLVSGFDYEIQVSLNDNRNAYLLDRWKGCGTLTALEYPNPEVKFELSKTQDSNAKVTENGLLTVRSGEQIKLDWAVTNVDGVDSCNISTDSDNIFSSNEYSGTLSKVAPSNLDTDKNYIIRLFCEGKEAKNIRTVDKKINLRVEAYPTVSCQIDGGKKSIGSDDNEVKLIARVGNVRNYIWKSGADNNDKTKNVQSNTRNNNSNPFVVDEFNINLNYGGIYFGQYQPWVEITKLGTSRTVITTCGTLTNLGNSTIKEINP